MLRNCRLRRQLACGLPLPPCFSMICTHSAYPRLAECCDPSPQASPKAAASRWRDGGRLCMPQPIAGATGGWVPLDTEDQKPWWWPMMARYRGVADVLTPWVQDLRYPACCLLVIGFCPWMLSMSRVPAFAWMRRESCVPVLTCMLRKLCVPVFTWMPNESFVPFGATSLVTRSLWTHCQVHPMGCHQLPCAESAYLLESGGANSA